MGIPHPGGYSLGEWAAIRSGWERAHRRETAPPTEDEFDAAVALLQGET